MKSFREIFDDNVRKEGEYPELAGVEIVNKWNIEEGHLKKAAYNLCKVAKLFVSKIMESEGANVVDNDITILKSSSIQTHDRVYNEQCKNFIESKPFGTMFGAIEQPEDIANSGVFEASKLSNLKFHKTFFTVKFTSDGVELIVYNGKASTHEEYDPQDHYPYEIIEDISTSVSRVYITPEGKVSKINVCESYDKGAVEDVFGCDKKYAYDDVLSFRGIGLLEDQIFSRRKQLEQNKDSIKNKKTI